MPDTRSAFIGGASRAAKLLGYTGVASLIESDRLGPDQIAAIFRFSAAEHGRTSVALILLTGAACLGDDDALADEAGALARASIDAHGYARADQRFNDLIGMAWRVARGAGLSDWAIRTYFGIRAEPRRQAATYRISVAA